MTPQDKRYYKCLYFSSNALARKTEKLAYDAWSKVDLSPSHGYLLLLVIDEPGIQPTAIASCLHLTPSTVTRLIAKLEEKKLIYRTTEGKITNVYPSAKGNALHPTLMECQKAFITHYTNILGDTESTKLAVKLMNVTDQLNA